MADERKNSIEKKQIRFENSNQKEKSPTGSDTSEIILSGDETCSSSGFRSGQNSDLGKIKNSVYTVR